MTSKAHDRVPQAFVIEAEKPASRKIAPAITFEPEPENTSLVHVPEMPLPSPSKARPWGLILLASLASLIGLATVSSIITLVKNYFQTSAVMGWASFSIAALALVSALAILGREVWGLSRLRRIELLQRQAVAALNVNDAKSGAAAYEGVKALYSQRPELARALQDLKSHDADIMDAKDRLRLAERLLIDPLDDQAHRIIARRARRVTLLTTVTPIASLDMLFVASQNLGMIRQLATLYGGRPSVLATLRLTKMTLLHLAVAGGLALSDNAFQLILGKGILGRLSARLGEGTVNGILTARIGLAAAEVCRPIPKPDSKRETLSSLIRELTSFKANS